MQYISIKYCKLVSILLHGLSLQVSAQDKPAELDWCFDNISGAHQMLNSELKPSGPSSEFIHYLAAEVGFTLSYLAPIPSLRCLKMLGSGEADIMTNLSYHPKLGEVAYLFQYEEKRNPSVYLLMVNDARVIDSVDALTKLRVVFVRGYFYGQKVLDLTEKNDFSHVYVASDEDAIGLLKKKRADVAILPSRNVSSLFTNEEHDRDLFRYVDELPELREIGAVYLGLSKKSQYVYLAPKIEASLNKAMKNGHIKRFFEQRLTPEN